MDKPAIAVKIFNETYLLRTEEDEAAVQEIAAVVDAKMQELSAKKKVQTAEKLAVWAALDLAGELYKLRQDYTRLLAAVKER